MVGHAFMGAAHSHAWRTAGRFFDLPRRVELTAVCGRSEPGVRRAAARYGWESHETDWRRLVERPDIDVVDICTPGDTHAQIALAALAAGKHVLCEKPLANSVAEAEEMAAAAERARAGGVRSMVAFNYRRVPALALARRLIAEGRLGTVRQVRASYLQDWLVDPEFPLAWRLRKERAGSGALGDLGAHSIDAAQFLTGQRIVSVGALLETFVTERPLPAQASGLSGTASSERGQVTVDDAALFTARFDGGAIGVFEATRFATGHKNAMRIEVSGSAGSLAFDAESLNELAFYDRSEDAGTAGFRRVLVTEPTHPYLDAWWPPGHLLGYEHTFTHQVRDFVTAVADGTDPQPSFAAGLRVQRVLAAVESSAAALGVHIPVMLPATS
ncbi:MULTISPECIES: Gfo/Idh/MocA family protein [unclassified Streptomyces]|uniref:Gfo/Idh/MocA family protein n=1 Tax=unclassified Streptomyces TaxID=2593676 RepID=UPI000B833C94|nr:MULTISPECIES: Gfo/Idh/MocA family oxidoreductase [unclassified Streptomyces]MYS21460.1 Gfo/Idh/MocA family oxidoreductase [Streptomyces sp. SID4948]